MLHGEREHLEDEAFFLSILLFLVLVSLDDFSYAGLSPTASYPYQVSVSVRHEPTDQLVGQ